MKQGNLLAYNDYEADRIRRVLQKREIDFQESASYGYLSFLMNGEFLLAVKGDNLELLINPSCMVFTIIHPIEFNTDNKLETWIDYILSKFDL